MEAKAARLVEHGKALLVETVELVDPAPGELTVSLAYGGVNPIDRYGALGRVAQDGPVPRTLGTEASGTVDGRKVLVRGHGLGTRRDGLWASHAVVPENALIDIPDGVEMPAAAAMGVAGVTAWRTVTEKAGVRPDDRVLVLGASGGVGSVIVSIAHALGATVWGHTGNEKKASWPAGGGPTTWWWRTQIRSSTRLETCTLPLCSTRLATVSLGLPSSCSSRVGG